MANPFPLAIPKRHSEFSSRLRFQFAIFFAMRLAIVFCISLGALSAAVHSQSFFINSHPRETTKPNIILVMADDLGTGALSCYGSKAVTTPNIDAMARDGLRFTNAYSGSTVCAQSRAILLTGRHAGRCSVRVNTGGVPLPDADVTIAEVLKGNGYRTGGFGKWALGMPGSTGDPQRQGFDEYFGYYHQTHGHDQYPEYLIHNGKRVAYPGNVGSKLVHGKPGFLGAKNPNTRKPLCYAPYEIFDAAKSFIKTNHARPFFCYLPITLPHGQFQIPESDPATKHFIGKDWDELSKVVSAMTVSLDRQMGDLYKLLEEFQIADNTLVIFCSDHGAAKRFEGTLDASGPYRGFKRSMYEGGIRIPLIAHWPDRIKPSESKLPVYLGDLFATLEELTGDQRVDPKTLDSISLVPTLLGNPDQQKRHEFFFWEWAVYNPAYDAWGKRMQAVRVGDMKLLRNSVKEPWELYDLNVDPLESKDLASDLPGEVKRLEEFFQSQSQPPAPQHEALADWMDSFELDKVNQRLKTIGQQKEEDRRIRLMNR